MRTCDSQTLPHTGIPLGGGGGYLKFHSGPNLIGMSCDPGIRRVQGVQVILSKVWEALGFRSEPAGMNRIAAVLLFLWPKNVLAGALKPGQRGKRRESKRGRGRKPRHWVRRARKPDAARGARESRGAGDPGRGGAAVPRQVGSRQPRGRRAGVPAEFEAPSGRGTSPTRSLSQDGLLRPADAGRGGWGPRIPRPSRPPERESQPARWDPSYFVPPGRAGKFVTFLRGAGMGRRGTRRDWAAGGEGREAASRAETRLLRPAQAPPLPLRPRRIPTRR